MLGNGSGRVALAFAVLGLPHAALSLNAASLLVLTNRAALLGCAGLVVASTGAALLSAQVRRLSGPPSESIEDLLPQRGENSAGS